MIHDLVSEISSYFRHQDHSLGVRRLLDVCLDINKPELTRKAIDLSRRFHQYEKDIKTTGAPADLLEAANELLHHVSSENIVSPSSEMLVSVNEVSKTYQSGNFTLSPVSFKVATGDILGVVGENGNGKTTLLRCLAGQLAIDTGSVDHTNIKDNSYYSIKTRWPSFHSVFPGGMVY